MRVGFSFFVLLLATNIFAADPAPSKTNAPAGMDLFNGKDLAGWKITDFGGQGETEIKDGQIIAHEGAILTGVQYTNSVPTNNYVLTLEAMKIEGDDFFCALTFPVNKTHCSLILGGWGGGVVGLSSLDGMDASENDTTKYLKFDRKKWYKIRLEVRPDSIKAWLDEDDIINTPLEDKKVGLRAGPIELQTPLGLSAYQTTAAWRKIHIAPLTPAKPAAKP